jgi:beta-xylosidase
MAYAKELCMSVATSSVISPITLTNPHLGTDFPDPSLLAGRHDGYYYAYATQSGMHNLRVARSQDLVNWDLLEYGVLAEKPSYAKNCRDFWAPCPVVENGQYRIYYSLRPDDAPGMGISVAISDRPEGGFRDDRDKPLKQGPGFAVIDPHYLHDPVENRKWLYYGSHSTPI